MALVQVTATARLKCLRPHEIYTYVSRQVVVVTDEQANNESYIPALLAEYDRSPEPYCVGIRWSDYYVIPVEGPDETHAGQIVTVHIDCYLTLRDGREVGPLSQVFDVYVVSDISEIEAVADYECDQLCQHWGHRGTESECVSSRWVLRPPLLYQYFRGG